MRADVSNWAQLDQAVYNHRAAAASDDPLILVIHTPGDVLFRFIVAKHGIIRQECDIKGEARE